jgi:hydrogenase maturation protease
MADAGEEQKVLVVGIGNELLGDEGLGVHVARRLAAAKDSLPPHVEVIEGGTSLFDLLPALSRCARVTIVDAVRAGREPGSIYRLERLDVADQCAGGPPVSLHDWGVLETLQAGRMLGMLPAWVSLIGAEPESIAPGTKLSPRLEQAAGRIVSMLLAELRGGCNACSIGATNPEGASPFSATPESGC